ncbi:hypothetical protein A9168_07450 [Macellibacteroides sp. HH-ZS]|nr:hypothetical protein A9168_07450 [Macellibacteroides sp. HH-ZS]
MKNLFIIMALAAMTLTSCSQEEPTLESSEKLVQVKFNVKALDINVEPMNTRSITRSTSNASSSSLTYIQYYLQNITTGKLYTGEQKLSIVGSEFGTIPLWVPAGTYNFAFMGYGENNPAGSASMYIAESPTSPNSYIDVKDKDVFYNITSSAAISTTDTLVDINISRLNAKLVLRLNDTIPSQISKIKAKITYFPRFNLNTNYATYNNTTGAATSTESFLTITNGVVNEFGFFVLPQSNATLTLTVYDDSSTELGAYAMKVAFYKNRRTIVDGNLLDVINQKPFEITVSEDWGDDFQVPLK